MQVLPHPGVRQAHALTLTLFPKPPATHGIKPAKPTKLYLTVCQPQCYNPPCPENQLMNGPDTSHQSRLNSLWFWHLASDILTFGMTSQVGLLWHDITSEWTALSWHHKWEECSFVTSQVQGLLLRGRTAGRTALWILLWSHRSLNCLHTIVYLL